MPQLNQTHPVWWSFLEVVLNLATTRNTFVGQLDLEPHLNGAFVETAENTSRP